VAKRKSTGEPIYVKPAHQKTEFKSDKEFEEFLKCCDPDTGYQYFLDNFFYIQHPSRGVALYEAFEYQRELAYNYHNYKRSINMITRQGGKTTTAAGYLLWYAMFVPDSTILIAAHKYAGALEIMVRVKFAYEQCPWHLKAGVVKYNEGSIVFDNGSRIVASTTTKETGRGMSISVLYCDELAYVRTSIAEAFMTSITPTLSTGGKAIITSTPNTDEDKFADIWFKSLDNTDEYGNKTELGSNGYKPFKVTWDKHPERDAAWEKQFRAELGDGRFEREMNCEFVSADETLINSLKIASIHGIEPIEKQGQVRWYKKPQRGKHYVVALDPSLGTGGDNAAIQVFEADTTTQIAEWKHNKTPIQDQIALVADICEYIFDYTLQEDKIYYSVENNTLGEAALVAIDEYGEDNIAGTFLSEVGKKRKGFLTSNKSKVTACAKLKQLVERGTMIFHSKPLISEIKNFVAVGGTYKAKPGTNDDLIMAAILALRMIIQIGEYHLEVESNYRNVSDYVMPMPCIMTSTYWQTT